VKESVPDYIIQNKRDQGFVLASGDVRLPAVFAYSEKGTFDTNTGTGLDIFCERLPLFIADSLERFQANYKSLLSSAREKLGIKSKDARLKSAVASSSSLASDGMEEPEEEYCEPLMDVEDIYCPSTLTEQIDPLVQVKWGQAYPYNKFCPSRNECSNTAVGCVAVATAQIMSYHKYPSSLGGFSFDWDNMTSSSNIFSVSSTYEDQ
jgi:hypothetical protein